MVLPIAGVAVLVALAPPLPPAAVRPRPVLRAVTDPFHYTAEPDLFSLDFDPRQVAIGLYEGWDRETEAYDDPGALAFVSGPMYERHQDPEGEVTVPLGDLKLGPRLWRGRNRSAARQRAYVGIRHDGGVEFGYGELTPERAARYDTFIGGLHSLYNDQQAEPASYKGAYSAGMAQQIRYLLPRIRVVFGLRPDGRLEMWMTRDGLTLDQTRALARQRGLVAAYMPDHASKSRFIVPGRKNFTSEDANWISGGATSFVHVPYMLRLSRRSEPLQGSLLARLSPQLPQSRCHHPLDCGQQLVSGVFDRALAGFNRLMERGVEPVARLVLAPLWRATTAPHSRPGTPLREPVITADPAPIQERQRQEQTSPLETLVEPPQPEAALAPREPANRDLPTPPGTGDPQETDAPGEATPLLPPGATQAPVAGAGPAAAPTGVAPSAGAAPPGINSTPPAGPTSETQPNPDGPWPRLTAPPPLP